MTRPGYETQRTPDYEEREAKIARRDSGETWDRPMSKPCGRRREVSETPKPPDDLLQSLKECAFEMRRTAQAIRDEWDGDDETRAALVRGNERMASTMEAARAELAALRSRVADLELMLRACAEGRAQIRPPGRGTHEPFIWIGSQHGERDGHPLRDLSLTDAARRALGGGG